MAEISLILTRMLMEFDISTCEETDPKWLDQRAWFGWDKKPLLVRVRAREHGTS